MKRNYASMKHNLNKLLEDVRFSISAVEQHIEDIESFDEYRNSLKTIDAVERRLAIIGEAIYQANKIDHSIPVTDKTKIIRFRHVLVHEYDLVNHKTVWQIIHQYLPVLKLEILALLNKE